MPRERAAIFFVGGRIIDFDTYLPVAMELKARAPEMRIIFVTFEPKIAQTVRDNPTLRRGLEKCGELHVLGGVGSLPLPQRLLKRARSFLQLKAWLLTRKRPVLFLGRPFSRLPYSTSYIVTRLQGGTSVVLSKTRSPDRVHDIVWQNRSKPTAGQRSLAARLFGKDADITADYHSDQSENFNITLGLGSARNLPHVRLGMPHLLPAWREHIDAEMNIAIESLQEDAVSLGNNLYCMFPAKPGSSINLRQADSVEFSLKRGLETLFEINPNATVLMRPHPLALDSTYVVDALKRYGSRVRLSFLHPEVLIALCCRSIFNNPTNITFSCFPGKLIDIADYADRHYEERGPVALSHGLGPLHVGPRWYDFAEKFSRALTNDDVFEDPALSNDRNTIISGAPSCLTPLLNAIGQVGHGTIEKGLQHQHVQN